MTILSFPTVDEADEHGLLGIGGDMEVDSLLLAYSQGIFPWPFDEHHPIPWFSPDPRGILTMDRLHISRSLRKWMKRHPWRIERNGQFRRVIQQCADSHRDPESKGTWMTRDLIKAYVALFDRGFAYSIEVLDGSDLIGGLYGVRLHQFVSAESMFHIRPNASKIAVVALMNLLSQEGIDWIDIQMLTPVTEAMGGHMIPRSDFLKRVRNAVGKCAI